MRHFFRVLSAVVLLASLTIPVGQSRAAIFAFGDSLSDTGNLIVDLPIMFDPSFNFSRFPTPPYVGGQASNGPVWLQQLASRLGMAPLAPSVAGGTNYAYIAALTRDFPAEDVQSPLGSPSLDNQVGTYLASNTPSPSDLFVLWGGSNDFLFGQENPLAPVTALSDQITSLALAGARRFLVPNLPLLGMTPSGAASGDGDALNLLSMTFNDALDIALDELRGGLGVSIYELDVEQFFLDVLADPLAFGLTNVTDPAVATDFSDPSSAFFGFPSRPISVADNPDEYLYWDGVHPTSVVHHYLGNLAADAVIPEPSTLVIWSLFALIGLAYCWRTRRGSA
jgi:phospholipase/lecithinase/hemolysin